jgi:predicted SnoaL-like aldol condensation-catalyzing enzyme
MFDGGGNSDAPTTGQQLAANKAVVDRLYEIQRSGGTDRLGDVIAADYIQHDPQVPSGLAAAQAFLRGIGPVDITTHRMLADGDLVLAHFTAQHLVGAEIFRIADDKIVERWGILQEIPPTTVSGNDMVSQLS